MCFRNCCSIHIWFLRKALPTPPKIFARSCILCQHCIFFVGMPWEGVVFTHATDAQSLGDWQVHHAGIVPMATREGKAPGMWRRGRLGGASYMPYATKIQATIHNFGGTDWKFQRGFWQASGCKDDVIYCVSILWVETCGKTVIQFAPHIGLILILDWNLRYDLFVCSVVNLLLQSWP